MEEEEEDVGCVYVFVVLVLVLLVLGYAVVVVVFEILYLDGVRDRLTYEMTAFRFPFQVRRSHWMWNRRIPLIMSRPRFKIKREFLRINSV